MRSMMKILFAFIGLLLAGCNLQFGGPAFPEKNGGKFLSEHGYSQEIIRAVIKQKSLAHGQVLEFSKISSTDVRFLVAKNPHLTTDEIDIYMKDKNDFARSGAALNRNLTRDQMLILMKDKSHTVYHKLAMNPAIPKDLLLKLHAERKPGLVWFASNPDCPIEIKEEILKSNDDLAIKWLNIVEGWKREGKYDKNGVWIGDTPASCDVMLNDSEASTYAPTK